MEHKQAQHQAPLSGGDNLPAELACRGLFSGTLLTSWYPSHHSPAKATKEFRAAVTKGTAAERPLGDQRNNMLHPIVPP